jgi:hypothetical protein
MEVSGHGKSYSTRSKTYKNFMEALIRRNIPNPGLHASFFLDAFWLSNIGEINKDLIVGRGLCSGEGREFSKWRDNLRDLKLLLWDDFPIPGKGQGTVKYRPGPLSTKYINTLVFEQTDTIVATKADLQQSEDKVIALQDAKHEELQKEIKEIKYMLSILADDYFERFPPKSKQREFRFIENVRKGVPYLEEDRVVY